ncbi:MAG: Tol-Pal system beta propeller repeat protein TolB [Nitrospirae bacterium RBG_13_39_12]|nr:MAG: Tol-Pal system beta propeller repeat protein TolB [Nitrospirae bacterium RBG_13_39_12]
MKIKAKIIISTFLLLTAYCLLLTAVEAKVYIDISSPAFKTLPIAIQAFSGPSGKEISDIIRDDLQFTGLFEYIDRDAYLEDPSKPFNPKNWTPIGVEAVVKGSVQEGKDLTVTMSLYDVFEGKEILKKEYKAEKEFIRPLSHAVANDIYFKLTGETGIFRSRISFVAEDKKGMGIYIMDWDGNRITSMGLKGNIILPPRWSKDGKKLIYSAERNRQWGIYLLDFISMSERKVFFSKGTNMVGDFFPEGNVFIFSSTKEGPSDIYKSDLKNNQTTKITSSYGIDVSPAVSPDGNYIAFVSDRGGSPQIYIMRADGSDVRRITFEGSYNTSPSWSPTGDRIVFTGRRGKNQIFTVRPDRTGLTQLTTLGNNEDPSFSPDGRYITFSSDRNGGKGIYIMRANGESQKRITPKNLRASGPRWSLD